MKRVISALLKLAHAKKTLRRTSLFMLGLGLAVITVHFASHALEMPDSSLHWQKMEIEDKLNTNITNRLKNFIAPEMFLVSVEIELLPPRRAPTPTPTPKPTPTPTPTPKPKPKRSIVIPDQGKKTPETDGTHLLLSKLGVWEPKVRHEEDEPEPEPKPTPIFIPTPVPIVLPTPVPRVDIFTQIKKIRIKALLEQSLDDEHVSVAKKAIQLIMGSFDPRIVEIQVEKFSLVQKKEEAIATPTPTPTPTPPTKWEALEKKIGPYVIPISILLAFITLVVLLLIVGMINNAKAAQAQARALAAQIQATKAASGAGDAQKAEKESEAATPEHGSNHDHSADGNSFTTSLETDVKETFEQFRALFDSQPESIVLLVKQWLANSPIGSADALRILPRYFQNKQMGELAQALNLEEKKSFRSVFEQTGDQQPDYRAAVNRLQKDLVSLTLPVNTGLSHQVQETLVTLRPDELAEIAKEDTSLGCLLINAVAPSIMQKTLNLLSIKEAEALLNGSMSVDILNLNKSFEHLKLKLYEIRGRRTVHLPPLLESASAIIGDLSPDKETLFFSTLAKSGQTDNLEKLGRQFYPSQLIDQLPTQALGVILSEFPLRKRAEIILSTTPEMAAKMLASFGESGKMRELIDSEIETIKTSPALIGPVNLGRDQIVKDFNRGLRERILSDPRTKAQAEELLVQWIQRFKEGPLEGGGDADVA